MSGWARAATPELVAEIGADAVLLATGAVPSTSGFSPANPLVNELPGVALDNVVTGWDVLLGVDARRQARRRARRRRLARGLRRRRGAARPRARVEVVTRFNTLFPQTVYNLDQAYVYGRCFSKGLRYRLNVWASAIDGASVTLFNLYTGARGDRGRRHRRPGARPEGRRGALLPAQGQRRRAAPHRRLRRAAEDRPCDLRGRARRPGAVEPGGALHLRGRARTARGFRPSRLSVSHRGHAPARSSGRRRPRPSNGEPSRRPARSASRSERS